MKDSACATLTAILPAKVTVEMLGDGDGRSRMTHGSTVTYHFSRIISAIISVPHIISLATSVQCCQGDDVKIDGWTDGWIDGWMDGWMGLIILSYSTSLSLFHRNTFKSLS